MATSKDLCQRYISRELLLPVSHMQTDNCQPRLYRRPSNTGRSISVSCGVLLLSPESCTMFCFAAMWVSVFCNPLKVLKSNPTGLQSQNPWGFPYGIASYETWWEPHSSTIFLENPMDRGSRLQSIGSPRSQTWLERLHCLCGPTSIFTTVKLLGIAFS